MANSATRIRNVTQIPGNDMNVEMRNRLTRGCSYVDANVEAVRRVISLHSLAGHGDTLGKGSSLSWRRIEPARHVAACDHEGMTF